MKKANMSKSIVNAYLSILLLTGASSSSATFKAQNEIAPSFTLRTMEKTHNGLNKNDVDSLMCHFNSGTRGAGDYFYEYNMYLLMKDGWAYEKLSTPLSELNPKVSRKKDIKTWVRWRKTGNQYEIKKPGDQWRKISFDQATPGKKDERLNRLAMKYGSSTGNSFTHSYRFDRGGRFSQGSTSLYASWVNSPVFTAVYSSKNDTGESRGAYGQGSGTSVYTSTKRGKGSDRRGEYVIDGYEIEFRFDNGNTKRELMAFCGKDKSSLYIGKRYYSYEQSSAEEHLPRDWNMLIDEYDNSYHRPNNLPRGADLRLSVSQSYKLGEESLDSYFREQLKYEQQMFGRAKGQQLTNKANQGLSVYMMMFQENKDGPMYAQYYVGNPVGSKNNVRVIRVLFNNAKAIKQNQEVITKLVVQTFIKK